MQCHSGFTDGEQPIVLSMCGHSVETIRYCVSQEKVSIHLPVSRLLAGINLVKNISGNGKCYINIICFCVGVMNHRTAVESLKYLVNLSRQTERMIYLSLVTCPDQPRILGYHWEDVTRTKERQNSVALQVLNRYNFP